MKYIGFFSGGHDERNLCGTLSAENKMMYIARVFSRNDEISIVSPSWTLNKQIKCIPGRTDEYVDGIKLTTFHTFGSPNILIKAIKCVYSQYQLFKYLLTEVKRKETIMVYHHLRLCTPVLIAKVIKGFKMILEAEEIYQNVQSVSPYLSLIEYKMFENADGYVFPTELLDKSINKNNKPVSIIHGTYHVESNRNCRFNDGKIHVVYAGTLDHRKGGAAAAAAAARFLPTNYHIHILGFGTEKQIQEIRELTAANSICGHATVTYDGLLSGEEYIRFIQSCDIGLSTQNPDAAFNATSFPSKVLSYMANGLRVVSVRIEAVERSAVGDLITYYDEQTPENIAKAIMSVDMSQPYDSRQRIAELDKQFEKDLKSLIEAVSNENH